MTFNAILLSDVGVILVQSLAHILWQGVFILALAWCVDSAIGRRSSRAAYAIWFSALCFSVLCLPINLLVLWPESASATDRIEVAASAVNESSSSAETFSHVETVNEVITSAARSSMPESDVSSADADVVAIEASASTVSERTTWAVISPCVVTVYAVGLFCMILRLLLAIDGGRRARSESVLISDPVFLSRCDRCARRVGLRMLPVVATCGRISCPVVVGVLKPVVLLPIMLTTRLSQEELESILLHEFAHIRRWDPLMNLVQRLAETVLFFQPTIWVISRRVSLSREDCCDDLVVQCGVDPARYAESLVSVSELRSGASKSLPPVTALAAAGSDESSLRQRIVRILNQPHRETAMALTHRGTMILVGFLIVAGLTCVSFAAANFVGADQTAPPAETKESVAAKNPDNNASPIQQKRADRLIAQLSSKDSLVREQSIRALSAMQDPGHVEVLISALRDPHADVRRAATYALHGIAGPEAVAPLVQSVEIEPLSYAVSLVIRTLHSIGGMQANQAILKLWRLHREQLPHDILQPFRDSDEPELNAALSKHLRNAQGQIDVTIAVLLLDRNADQIANVIVQELPNLAKKDQHELAGKLAEAGDDRCLPTLLQLLSDGDGFANVTAIHSLGKLGNTAAVAPILAATADVSSNWNGYRVREIAARALAAIGGPVALKSVSNWASDSEWPARQRSGIVGALGNSNDPALVEVLLSVAESEKDSYVLAEIARVLGKVGDDRTIALLERLSKHKDPRVHGAATSALGAVKVGAMNALWRGDQEKALELASATLQSPDETMAIAAVRALSRINDPRVFDLLTEASDDPRQAVRYRVYSVCTYYDDPRTSELLVKLTADPDEKISFLASNSLARTKDDRAIEPLLKFSRSENVYHRRKAASALESFPNSQVVARLTEMLTDEDDRVRSDAMKALAATASNVPIDKLLSAIQDSTNSKQLEPLIAILGRVPNPRAVAKLEELLAHDDSSVRRATARALAQLGWVPQNRSHRLRYLAASGRQKEVEREVLPAVPSGKSRVTGEFQLDVPITASIKAGTAEWPSIVWTQSVEFVTSKTGLKGTVRAGNYSYPASKWRIEIDLYNANDQKVGSASGVKHVSGFRSGAIAMVFPQPLQLEFDGLNSDAVKTFELSVTEIPVPQMSGQPVVDITPPVETDYVSEKLLADKVIVKTPRGAEVLSISNVRFSASELVKERPRVTAKLSIRDGDLLEAKWRLWVLVLDDSGAVKGRGEHYFSTAIDSGSDGSTTKNVEMPVTLPRDWEPGGRVRFCVAMVPLTEEEVARNQANADSHVVPDGTVALSHVDDTAETKRSLAASGHAVKIVRTGPQKFVEAIQIFSSRYGTPKPPADDFHVCLLNEKQQVLSHLKYPYALIPRGEMKWHTLRTPSIEVPETFFVAVAFNPHATKGVYLGLDEDADTSHSLTGLAGDGFTQWSQKSNWMIRAHLAEKPTGERGVQKLADWKPPAEAKNPFASSIEFRTDSGKSDGQQSYGGAGPVVQIPLADLFEKDEVGRVKLIGLRIYASRYGSGFDPNKTKFHVNVMNKKVEAVWQHHEPYSAFGYKPKWVDVVFDKPIAIADWLDQSNVLTIGIDPESHQRKGVYFHYSKPSERQPSTLAKGFVPDKRFFDVKDRQWMIRAYLTTDKSP